MVRCHGLLDDLLQGVPLSVLKVYTIWLPWLLIFMRIQEMLNVTDGRDRYFVVDFLFLFSIAIQRAWIHIIFSITDASHMSMLRYHLEHLEFQTKV